VRRLAVTLLHYPVLDREGRSVTSAVTNIDIHDIARSCFTYGVELFYLVHPIMAQRTLVERVRAHWVDGTGKDRIPDRAPPMSRLRIASHLDEVLSDFAAGGEVELWTTSARPEPPILSHREARERLAQPGPPVVLALGTGWGLAETVHRRAGFRLAPIISPRADRYNHLSVRAAAAILLDRLLAEPAPTP
jgi:hypothetical protein